MCQSWWPPIGQTQRLWPRPLSVPTDVTGKQCEKQSHFQCIGTPQVSLLCLYVSVVCVRAHTRACACVCVCLSVWSAVVCLSVYEQRRSVCVHCPTASAENKKTPARWFGCWLSKSRREKYGGGEGEKKISQQPRDISILTPRIPQADGRRLQNGSSPPCYRMGSALSKCLWLENTDWEVFPSFTLFPHPRCFSHFLCLSPPACRPSFTAHGKGSSSSPAELSPKRCLLHRDRERKRNHSLPPYRPLSLSPLRWSCARVLCLGEVSASQSQVHFSLKCDVYLLGPVGRTAWVSVAFVRSDCDPQIAPGLWKTKTCGKHNLAVRVN